MPRAPKLLARTSVRRTATAIFMTVAISANIHGDRRPMQGARVTLGGHTLTTTRRGRAVFTIRRTGAVTLHASAGGTFPSLTRRFVLPRL